MSAAGRSTSLPMHPRPQDRLFRLLARAGLPRAGRFGLSRRWPAARRDFTAPPVIHLACTVSVFLPIAIIAWTGGEMTTAGRTDELSGRP